jgi:hypothetical protein
VSWDAGEETHECESRLVAKLGADYDLLAVKTVSSSQGRIERGLHLKFHLWPGCRLREETRLRIWPTIRAAVPCFRCARVQIAGGFAGCVLDFVRPSLCPQEFWEIAD